MSMLYDPCAFAVGKRAGGAYSVAGGLVYQERFSLDE